MKLQDAILTSFTLFTPPCSAIFLGWSDPVGHFGHSTVPKSGVAPAQHGVLPASKSKAAPCATHMLPTTSRHPRGDANGEAKGDVPCLLDRHSPDYSKVTTGEARSREHRKPVNETGRSEERRVGKECRSR